MSLRIATSPRLEGWVLPFCATLGLALLFAACKPGSSTDGDATGDGSSQAIVATESIDLDSAALYFPGTDGRLHLRRQAVEKTDQPERRVEALVKALLAGPIGASGEDLVAPLPESVVLSSAYFLNDGTVAVLDFRSTDENATDPAPSGSRHELVTVYSLVNSVVENTDRVRQVVLMWNGRQLDTLAGHVDLTRPLGSDLSLVAPSPSGR